MERTNNDSAFDFPIIFAYLVVLAWAATIRWIDLRPDPPTRWPLIVLWACVCVTWISFRLDGTWCRWAMTTFIAGILIVCGASRILGLM
ncbi:MAG: hypothetical protein ABL967_20810 [Bryobacteraceae bacterium]